MSKEDEMMEKLDELLKTKIGRTEEKTDEFGFEKYGIHHAYPRHIFRYMDTDILSIRDKNNYKFQEYINKLIDRYMEEKNNAHINL